jgi:hypothetical protein
MKTRFTAIVSVTVLVLTCTLLVGGWTRQSGGMLTRASFDYSSAQGEVLPPPAQLYPADGTTFSHFPRQTVLVWEKVPDSSSYTVEIDCYHCCTGDAWCTDEGRQWRLIPGLTKTVYAFQFVGAQPGRWRVWAVGADGVAGAKSEWSQFSYTR